MLEAQLNSIKWYHTIHFPEHGLTSNGEYTPEFHNWILQCVPKDLKGKRVLDIGALDGYYSFECEKRGAKVTAIEKDFKHSKGFVMAKTLLNSNVEHYIIDLFEYEPKEKFDLILFTGVYYHLQDPFLAIRRIAEWTNHALILEGFYLDGKGKYMQFYPTTELNNDNSNWWSATEDCLKSMLQSAGFNSTMTLQKSLDRIIIGAEKI